MNQWIDLYLSDGFKKIQFSNYVCNQSFLRCTPGKRNITLCCKVKYLFRFDFCDNCFHCESIFNIAFKQVYPILYVTNILSIRTPLNCTKYFVFAFCQKIFSEVASCKTRYTCDEHFHTYSFKFNTSGKYPIGSTDCCSNLTS
ncbi:hypothetical protein ES705_32649 [subsurface metagenome]